MIEKIGFNFYDDGNNSGAPEQRDGKGRPVVGGFLSMMENQQKEKIQKEENEANIKKLKEDYEKVCREIDNLTADTTDEINAVQKLPELLRDKQRLESQLGLNK